jgi:hypothetical protein
VETTVLATQGQYRLVRYEPSGEARIEDEDGKAHSNWLSARDVDRIRAHAALLAEYDVAGGHGKPSSVRAEVG